MSSSTCPNCGFDLKTLDKIESGHLTIVGNAAFYWKGRRVALSTVERLIVAAIVRANGGRVRNHTLADAIGYDGPDPSGTLSVHICRIKHKFRAIDPVFDQIETGGRGCAAEGGARWRAEAYIIPELRAITAKQRRTHKLLLENPGCSIPEWVRIGGWRSSSSLSQNLKALERRRLVKREKRYQRGWTAIGSLAMHAEIEAHAPGENGH